MDKTFLTKKQTFLTKKQIKSLQGKGWKIPPKKLSKERVIFFGQDWKEESDLSLNVINKAFPDLLDTNDKSIIGYNFLVVGVHPVRESKDEDDEWIEI
tara:strand:- start:936 stop:1229 length:294 start_codon:yes stop_codon:yes gene_type:complete